MVDFLNPLISAAAGLGGVFLGGRLGDRRERDKRRNDFIARQLSEFYGPLLALASEVQARENISDKLAEAVATLDDETIITLPEIQKAFVTYMSTDSEAWHSVVFPLYRQMLTLFREKLWLAELETRSYYLTVINFVDAWERTLQPGIPGEAIRKLGVHYNQQLLPFYSHIERTHAALRDQVAKA